MKTKQQIRLLHVLFCTLFLLQPFLLPSRPPIGNADFFSPDKLSDFISNVLIIVFFYVNYFIFIPKFYFNKKYFTYISLLVISISAIIGIATIKLGRPTFDGHLPPLPPPDFQHFDNDKISFFTKFQQYFSEIDQVVFLFTVIVFFSLLLKVRSRLFNSEKAKNDAEISSLMYQINPHFLFNALNSIYALTLREKADKSSQSILKLSGMMRYVVTETKNEFVDLEQELNYINDFIELQKLRLDKSIKLQFNCIGNSAGKKIAPLILIPFIENAFKHGVNPDAHSLLEIFIEISDDILNMKVTNNKVQINHENIEKSGFGLENTIARLQLIYPHKHELNITDINNQYTVSLKIFFK